MGASPALTDTMTAREFFAWTDTRPDGERWELLDGVAEMNAAPSFMHQTILGNIFAELRQATARATQSWVPVLGFGLRITDKSVPVPDLLVRPNTPLLAQDCDDAIFAIEILSPSTAHKDRRLKRTLYANLPSLQQYVIVAQDAVAVWSFERHEGFAEKRLEDRHASLDLPALGVTLPLADLYRNTGL